MSLKTTLIDVATLATLEERDILIVDCRFELGDPDSGARAYRAGHIPGAVYANLDRDLSDLSRQGPGLGRHPLPLEEAFSRKLAAWGWRSGMQVVAYDAHGGALAAARLWWLLRLVGVPAAVLDGGYAAWVDAGRPVQAGEGAPRAPSDVHLHYDARQLVLDHQQLLDPQAQQLLDARAAPRFRGDEEPLDRVGGHVPGARNRPFADNLDAAGHFKAPAQLRAEFDAVLGDTPPERVVHMCGSGVTACHNLLA
ncbi:MAG: sulfurtransferase, partial [Rhodanobacter sp.]